MLLGLGVRLQSLELWLQTYCINDLSKSFNLSKPKPFVYQMHVTVELTYRVVDHTTLLRKKR